METSRKKISWFLFRIENKETLKLISVTIFYFLLFQEPQTSKSKVEIPFFELTLTNFEPRDLILEVDEDIPTTDK